LDDTACRHLLVHALASASLCVMQRGCVPPSWEKVCERVRQSPALIDSP
jgi:fructokinase